MTSTPTERPDPDGGTLMVRKPASLLVAGSGLAEPGRATVASKSRSIQPSPADRFRPGENRSRSAGIFSSRVRSRTGTSIAQAIGSILQTPSEAARAATPRTSSRILPRPVGSGTLVVPPASDGTSKGVGSPSIDTSSSRRPAGTVSATSVRPRFSMSNTVSHSIHPESWHQAVVDSRHTQARASATSGGATTTGGSPVRRGNSAAAA